MRLGLTDVFVYMRVLQNLAESNQTIRELQVKQATLSDTLAQQKQQLTEVSSINYALDTEEINLQDAKERVRSSTANWSAALQYKIPTCEHTINVVVCFFMCITTVVFTTVSDSAFMFNMTKYINKSVLCPV